MLHNAIPCYPVLYLLTFYIWLRYLMHMCNIVRFVDQTRNVFLTLCLFTRLLCLTVRGRA